MNMIIILTHSAVEILL